jgi:hypothetical protein
MRLALALFNKTVTPSQTYDVLTNKDYDVGRPFMFSNCYDLLMERFPARLEPPTVGTTSLGVEHGGNGLFTQQDFDCEGEVGVVDERGAGDSDGAVGGRADRHSLANRISIGIGSGPAGAPRSRQSGSKSAKRRKRQTSLDETNDDNFGSVSVALSSYTDVFKSVSDRALRVTDEGAKAKQLSAGAASLRAGLDAYRILFADNDGASTKYRDEYRDFLRKQAIQQAHIALQRPSKAVEAAGPSLTGSSFVAEPPLTVTTPHVQPSGSNLGARQQLQGLQPVRPELLSFSDSLQDDLLGEISRAVDVRNYVEPPCGFRCAASCAHPHLPIPPSVCPSQGCNGDENGGGRVHDLCALVVWEDGGETWAEPTTGNSKFCSNACFLRKQNDVTK